MNGSESLIEIRCPTCGARQPRSTECRRCRCDLSLFLVALDRRQHAKGVVLNCLRDGRHAEALQAARRFWSLSPDKDAARLMAVTLLLAGRYHAALDVYDTATSAAGGELG